MNKKNIIIGSTLLAAIGAGVYAWQKTTTKKFEKERIAIIGSGNWGMAISRIIGLNVLDNLDLFEKEVRVYVYEELIDGKKLTEIINTQHENVKYLSGIKIPENVIAIPDIVKAVTDATVLVFVTPHQFLPKMLDQLKGNIIPGARAITLIKGFVVDEKDELHLISKMISDKLEIEVSALMGANVANEVARDEFCETTIGCKNKNDHEMFKTLFDRPTFKVNVVSDVYGVELCGSLKNIVALGAGFCDGLGLGGNTKAAIIRIGLIEMKKFAHMFFSGVREETFLESCGIADLITTCTGGRNRKVSEAFVKTKKSWVDLEKELLGGQKLQGTLTADEVYRVLKKQNKLNDFPLFVTIYRIVKGEIQANLITQFETAYKKD
ncbi:nad-dependent glycerol-3-phosphate dehydrogenase [Anaeramoeba ignava]|uniref:Glycerol-3-phosphate dehydrogenase [NAD(+)] n=1 Tax=Anaeramoeba ignava TaxID=1746090 RepID=A0A9Q0L9J5_ANAIG|nr:nad-dependent glycerol-3-phosphate dehydrogenase [Anaeramoeba ignava]